MDFISKYKIEGWSLYIQYLSDKCLKLHKMRLTPLLLSSAAAVAISCVSAAAYYYKSRNTEINEVMVFCKLQYNPYNYFDKLVSFIKSAKHSIKVCMPGIQNPAIQAILVNLLKSNKLNIQILIDRSGYNGSTDFLIKELIEAGAEIKCKANEPMFNMQHKFCLVDEKILMTGTLNWGNDRSYDHWNYVYITSKHQLVEPVRKQFYQIWKVANAVQTVFDIYCDSDAETVEVRKPDESEVGDDNKNATAIMDTPVEKQMELSSLSIENTSLDVL